MILVLFDRTPNELEFLNKSNDHFHFTMDFDYSSVRFLDIQITKENDTLITNLYRKPIVRKKTILRSEHCTTVLKEVSSEVSVLYLRDVNK